MSDNEEASRYHTPIGLEEREKARKDGKTVEPTVGQPRAQFLHHDVIFTGNCVAHANEEMTDHDTWVELKLFTNVAGGFVGQRITHQYADMSVHETVNLASAVKVMEFFGATDLAQRLYDRAGISVVPAKN